MDTAPPEAWLVEAARLVATVGAARGLSLWLHELSHVASASAMGYSCKQLDLHGARPSVTVTGCPTEGQAALIRHAGWATSVALAALSALVAARGAGTGTGIGAGTGAGVGDEEATLPGVGLLDELLLAAVALGCAITAGEAVQSDLLSAERPRNRFFCGNFGMLLLAQASASRVEHFLRLMVKVTMMRGAQSAGVVTYQRVGKGGKGGKGGKQPAVFHGARYRVVNGKRTDLSDKIIRKARAIVKPTAISAPAIFQGHTRFATSSIADLDGCHPHQWTPRARQRHWFDDLLTAQSTGSGFAITSTLANVEAYITHNGDLDFFEIHGVVYPLNEIQMVRARGTRGGRPYLTGRTHGRTSQAVPMAVPSLFHTRAARTPAAACKRMRARTGIPGHAKPPPSTPDKRGQIKAALSRCVLYSTLPCALLRSSSSTC